jgi:hypothetical protein
MSDADADLPERQLAAYTRDRDDLLVRIVGVLQADVRVRSAWLTGSFGRGEADAWSDIDRTSRSTTTSWSASGQGVAISMRRWGDLCSCSRK